MGGGAWSVYVECDIYSEKLKWEVGQMKQFQTNE